MFQNGLYREHSPSGRQVYSSTITVSKTIYDPDAIQQEQMVSASSASPRLQASPRSTLDRRSTGLASSLDRRSTGLANSPSLVGSNLSELDTLLDDLNTSTKMYSTSTMERRTAGSVLARSQFRMCTKLVSLYEILPLLLSMCMMYLTIKLYYLCNQFPD